LRGGRGGPELDKVASSSWLACDRTFIAYTRSFIPHAMARFLKVLIGGIGTDFLKWNDFFFIS